MLAGALRSMADALTPPPNKMLAMAMAYHQTVLVHLAQKMEIPDLLAGGPRTAAAVAVAVRSEASHRRAPLVCVRS